MYYTGVARLTTPVAGALAQNNIPNALSTSTVPKNNKSGLDTFWESRAEENKLRAESDKKFTDVLNRREEG